MVPMNDPPIEYATFKRDDEACFNELDVAGDPYESGYVRSPLEQYYQGDFIEEMQINSIDACMVPD